ncbi:hypothetical protein HMPREF9422_0808 [Streptococcus cristatus ATCC 51100]|nr:hypothetical protein HMPREF9422_0808 [Streptococcus cristatus ATCC 51100]
MKRRANTLRKSRLSKRHVLGMLRLLSIKSLIRWLRTAFRKKKNIEI